MDGNTRKSENIESESPLVKIAHTVPLSMGQFALALGKFKHIHYMHLEKPYAPGTKLLLSCEIDGETSYIPIYVKSCTPATEGELTNGTLSGAGYYKKKDMSITAASIADTSLGTEAPIYSVDFGIDTRRDLNKSDLKPEYIRRLQRESAAQLYNAFTALEPKVAEAHAAANRSFPPQSTRPDDFDKEAYFGHVDKSLQSTFFYLRKVTGDAGLYKFMRAMASTHEDLSQMLKNDSRPKAKIGSAEPNEFDGHQQALAGFTHIYTDQGSGMLAAMGVKTRIALRGPLLTHHVQSNKPETSSVIAVDYEDKGVKRALMVPITVDRSDAPTFYANDITDEIAHMHGHKNSKAMKRSLRISDKENPILYSYAFRLSDPQELVWFDQKAEDIRMNMTQDFYKIYNSGKDSVRSAMHFMEENLSPEEVSAAITRITPYKSIRGTPEEAARIDPERGRAPQSSIGFRTIGAVDAAKIDHRGSHEALRTALGQKSVGRF